MNIIENLKNLYTITNDFDLITAIRTFRCRPLLEFYATFHHLGRSQNRPIIMDIGANVGDFSIACTKIWQNCTVYSFEPVPNTFKILQSRCAKFSSINPINLAIAEKKEDQVIYSHENNKLDSLLQVNHDVLDSRFTRDLPFKKITVACDTLADAINETVKNDVYLIKLDTQGSELQALSTIAKARYAVRFVQIELSPYETYFSQPTFSEVVQFMAFQNYRLRYLHSPLYNSEKTLVHIEGIFELTKNLKASKDEADRHRSY